jgi:hypothetical protein
MLMQGMFKSGLGGTEKLAPGAMTDYQRAMLGLRQTSEERYQEAEKAREAHELLQGQLASGQLTLAQRKEAWEEFLGATKETREAQVSAADIGLKHAQTQQSYAETGRIGVLTKNAVADGNRATEQYIWAHSGQVANQLLMLQAQGLKLSPSQTNELEAALRIHTGNMSTTLPRTSAGGLDMPDEQVAGLVTDGQGNPSMKYQQEMHNFKKIDSGTPLGKYSNLLMDLKRTGAPQDMIDAATKGLVAAQVKAATVPRNTLLDNVMTQFAARGDLMAGATVVGQLESAMSKKTPWDSQSALSWNRSTTLQNQLQDLMVRRNDLEQRGLLPQGSLSRRMASFGFTNDDTGRFVKDAMLIQQEFLADQLARNTDMTSDAKTDLQKSIPTIFDDPSQWNIAMPQYIDLLRSQARRTVGLARARNEDVPVYLEGESPEELQNTVQTENELLKDGSVLPPSETNQALDRLRTQTKAQDIKDKSIGGVSDARDKGATTTPSPTTTTFKHEKLDPSQYDPGVRDMINEYNKRLEQQ